MSVLDKNGAVKGHCLLIHTEVKAEVSGMLSSVTVRQYFRNPFETPIEAVYTFPLPQNAAIDSMTIHINDRTIRGIIKEREEARKTYEEARKQGQVAALLNQERPNIFTQILSNIMPGENIEVNLSYTEPLEHPNGEYQFVFQMVIGLRYIPGSSIGKQGRGWSADTAGVPDASRSTPQVTPKGTRFGRDIAWKSG